MVFLHLRVPSLNHVDDGEAALEKRGEKGVSPSRAKAGKHLEKYICPSWLGENSLTSWKPLLLGSACHSTPSRPSTRLSRSGGPGDAHGQTLFLQTLQPQVPSLSCNRHFVFPLSLSHCHSLGYRLPFDTRCLTGLHISIHTRRGAPPPYG